MQAECTTAEEELQSDLLFPDSQYMKEYYPWLEGKEGLLPLAWLCRGVHGLLHRDSMERARTLKDREKYRMMMEIYHNLNLNFVK